MEKKEGVICQIIGSIRWPLGWFWSVPSAGYAPSPKYVAVYFRPHVDGINKFSEPEGQFLSWRTKLDCVKFLDEYRCISLFSQCISTLGLPCRPHRQTIFFSIIVDALINSHLFLW